MPYEYEFKVTIGGRQEYTSIRAGSQAEAAEKLFRRLEGCYTIEYIARDRLKLSIGDSVEIETSEGRVRGEVEHARGCDVVLFRNEAHETLSKLFFTDASYHVADVDGDWLKIQLDDQHYGAPEYKYKVVS